MRIKITKKIEYLKTAPIQTFIARTSAFVVDSKDET